MEPSDFPTRETVYAKIRADLDQYGWSLISSIYRDELFTHTVGLSWGYEHQEIELIGLNQEIAAMLLNELARRVVNGEKFHANCHFEDIVDGVDLILVENPIDPQGKPMTNGRLRLIWPDENNLYPWQRGCEEDCQQAAHGDHNRLVGVGVTGVRQSGFHHQALSSVLVPVHRRHTVLRLWCRPSMV